MNFATKSCISGKRIWIFAKFIIDLFMEVFLQCGSCNAKNAPLNGYKAAYENAEKLFFVAVLIRIRSEYRGGFYGRFQIK
jgi:hypothetical protein